MYNIKRQVINSSPNQKDIYSVVGDIKKGIENIGGGIKLDPDYQRSYKFGIEQSSLLIESLIIGIPIPTIYLATDTSKDVVMYNVIDGQHRLRTIYNYIENEYALKGLKKNSDLNGKFFNDLGEELQNIILYQNYLSFINIHVQNNPEIELEIFERYNRNTTPLTEQEIRNAVYQSEFLDLVQLKVKEYSELEIMKTNFNLSANRVLSEKFTEDLCTGIAIMDRGLDKRRKTSPQYAENILKYYFEYDKNLSNIFEKLNLMESVIEEYEGKYLFSKEIIGDTNSNYKFQIPSFMIFSYIIHVSDEITSILELYRLALYEHNRILTERKTSSTNPLVMDQIKNFIDMEINEK